MSFDWAGGWKLVVRLRIYGRYHKAFKRLESATSRTRYYCIRCLPRSNLSRQCWVSGKISSKITIARIFPRWKNTIQLFVLNMLWNVPVSWKALMLDFMISKASSWSLISFLSHSVLPASAPSELQLELIKLQSDDTLKAMYLNKPLFEFYRVYVWKEEFPNLRASALKGSSVFGSTYLCEQFFSKMNITKSR